MNEDGEAAGIFVELLNAIAKAEGWNLNYIPGTWTEGLERLQKNELDLMPDVALTAERSRIMDFHSEFVLTSWSQIYARKHLHIELLGDLDGMKVAILKDSVQENVLRSLDKGLNLSLQLVPVDSFDEAFRIVVANQADAVIANQFYGDMVYMKHGLKKTPVIFNPVALYFVTNKGHNADVLQAIDQNIRVWQKDAESPYFQVLGRWMRADSRPIIPRWVFALMLVLAIGLSVFVTFNTLLQRKVDEATASLKRTNAKLLLSEQKWRGYIQNAPYGIFIVNEHGIYQELNPMACEMTGYREKELLGQPITTLIPQEYQDQGRAQFELLLEEGFMENEFPLKTKAGEVFWARICARRLDEHHYIGFHENIQAMKDARKEHLALQAELFHAHKLDAIGRLAGGVAHDYNNMLGVILGGCELMKMKTTADSPGMEELEHIYDAATRSAKLTRQLLSFSRKQDVCPVVLNLNEVVDDLQPLLNSLIEKNIHLTWRPCPEPLHVLIDSTFVDQILMNLCINARDAIQEHGTISISTDSCFIPSDSAREISEGVFARLQVTDNGTGMDEETQRRIFEPFFTTKPRDQGTGMGLSTVYGIVRQANGYIRVHSHEGEGTRFEIGFPLLSTPILPTA